MLHILHYQFIDDFVMRREEFRGDHLKLLQEWMHEGLLLMAGSYGAPPFAGMLVFDAEIDDIERFVELDPFFINGFVVSHDVQPWNVVSSAPYNIPVINFQI